MQYAQMQRSRGGLDRAQTGATAWAVCCFPASAKPDLDARCLSSASGASGREEDGVLAVTWTSPWLAGQSTSPGAEDLVMDCLQGTLHLVQSWTGEMVILVALPTLGLEGL